jgi:nicotinamidase/pyrazinamidase
MSDSPRRLHSSWKPDDPAERYDPHTCLLVVDVQNDFADPAGSLYVKGGEEVVSRVNAETGRALTGGAAVVYTQDWHPQHTPHFAPDGGTWPVHCVRGTWGAEFHPQLIVRGPVVRKGMSGEDGYSGFMVRDPEGGGMAPTELDASLAAREISRIVVCGLATDYCVKATALDGLRLGYETAVLRDAIRAVDLAPGDGERALDEIWAAGVILVGGAAGGAAAGGGAHAGGDATFDSDQGEP